MFPILLSYLFFSNIIRECYCNQYCSPEVCNNSSEHTLCKFPSKDAASHCVNFEKIIKTDKDRQAILNKLNNRRNKVAAGEIRSLPSAENMIKLLWNDELELSAQRWANQCVKHSVPDIKDTCRDLGNMYVGQNIATIYGDSPGLTVSALVDVWYMELLNMNASVLPRYEPSTVKGYAHYNYFTQLVWALSSEVGCGGVSFKEQVPGSKEDKTRAVYRLVCNFAPGGNIINQTVYSEGIPCSNCKDGFCDHTYKSLCTSKPMARQHKQSIRETKHVPISYMPNTLNLDASNSIATPANNDPIKDEDLTPFDYFSHYHQFTRASLSTPTTKPASCKDVLAVDEFVELLKSKLSTDPMFKELMQKATSSSPNGVTDATVAALVNLVYSKKVPPTTTKLPENEYVNSTLLVDLVEAVIFRSADKVSDIPNLRTDTVVDVSPVKIQAELAEVKLNDDFTGHYFFPEDEDSSDEVSSNPATDSYYDAESISMSDVILELEELKRNKVVTKGFLDEILESETATERSQKTNYLDITREMWKTFDEDQSEVRRKRNIKDHQNAHAKLSTEKKANYYVGYADKQDNISSVSTINKRLLRSCDKSSEYFELLKRLANDIGRLKLNEKFHCLHNNAPIRYHKTLTNMCIIKIFFMHRFIFNISII